MIAAEAVVAVMQRADATTITADPVVMTTMTAVTADGLATPADMPKQRDAVGTNVVMTGIAMTAVVILPAVMMTTVDRVGMMMMTAVGDGTGIPVAMLKLRGAAGTNAGTMIAATAVLPAMTKAAIPAVTMTVIQIGMTSVVTPAVGMIVVIPVTTTTAVLVDGATAAGSEIRKDIPKPRVAAGMSDVIMITMIAVVAN